jgi:hypothetical protein
MGSRPKVQKQDPEGDAQRAKDKATAEANREAALKRGGARTALSGDQSSQGSQQQVGGIYGALQQTKQQVMQQGGLYGATKKQLGG